MPLPFWVPSIGSIAATTWLDFQTQQYYAGGAVRVITEVVADPGGSSFPLTADGLQLGGATPPNGLVPVAVGALLADIIALQSGSDGFTLIMRVITSPGVGIACNIWSDGPPATFFDLLYIQTGFQGDPGPNGAGIGIELDGGGSNDNNIYHGLGDETSVQLAFTYRQTPTFADPGFSSAVNGGAVTPVVIPHNMHPINAAVIGNQMGEPLNPSSPQAGTVEWYVQYFGLFTPIADGDLPGPSWPPSAGAPGPQPLNAGLPTPLPCIPCCATVAPCDC